MKRLLMTGCLSLVLLVSPLPAQANPIDVGCVIFPDTPLMINYTMVSGQAEQQCYPGKYIEQRLRVRLQEKIVIPFWFDEWHTKKIQVFSYWTVASWLSRRTNVRCDTRAQHWWRVRADGQFINTPIGARQFGGDFSEERFLPCHVHDDQV